MQKRTRIEELGRKLDKLEEKLENTIKGIKGIETDFSSATDSLKKQDPPKDTRRLQSAVTRAQRKADLEDECKTLQSK